MTPKKNISAVQAGRKGAASVEFAIAAYFLLMLMLACTDFGRFVYVYVEMSNAAREGANFGSLHGIAEFGNIGAWKTAVANAAIGETTALSIAASDVTVDGAAVASGLCRVTVEQQFQVLIPWPGLPATVTLTCKVVMPLTP